MIDSKKNSAFNLFIEFDKKSNENARMISV